MASSPDTFVSSAEVRKALRRPSHWWTAGLMVLALCFMSEGYTSIAATLFVIIGALAGERDAHRRMSQMLDESLGSRS